jgi:Xaa-Pro dipeptidase
MTGNVMPLFDDATLDLAGMRHATCARLRREMERRGVEAVWLFSPGNLRYAMGASTLPADAGRAIYLRASVVIGRDAEHPHLFTPYPEGAPSELPADFVHGALDVESPTGIAAAVRRICDVLGRTPTETVALDEYSPSLFFNLSRELAAPVGDAMELVGTVKIRKAPEEVECIRRAQAINEHAMLDVQAALRAGPRPSDLTAVFFRRIYELGATANGIDPIWQVMPPRIADGPWTSHGDVAFPTAPTDRPLREGDVLWVDTGIDYHGYQSDFGRTFIVGARPTRRQLDQGKRWLDVVEAVLDILKPGVTGLDLTHRAIEVAGGRKPWLEHFYLSHGIGTDAAEQPLIGTDLGAAFDESIVLAPGMLCVLEPVIWDDGFGGYRSEEIVAVTDSGYQKLSSYGYAPYEDTMGKGAS